MVKFISFFRYITDIYCDNCYVSYNYMEMNIYGFA
jgi:hypothetical protein